jgi:hypothetical protein
MKKHILGLTIAAGTLWVGAPGCDQPTPQCTVGTASFLPYAAKYTLTSDPASSCEALPGDLVGMQTYNPDSGGTPDASIKTLAIQAQSIGALVDAYQPDADETHKLYSMGAFEDVEPNDSDLCIVSTLSPAQQVLGDVACLPNGSGCTGDFECCSGHCDPDAKACADPPCGGGGGGGGGGGAPSGSLIQRATDITYEWSNVNIYVTASALGNQAQAQLTIRDAVANCSATYKVTMVWPAVGCEKLEFLKAAHPPDEGDPENDCDDDPGIPCNPSDRSTCVTCDPATDEDCEAVPTGEPENKLCDDEPDPEPQYAIPFGSGISPDLKVKCDPDLLLCVLDSESIPAFR